MSLNSRRPLPMVIESANIRYNQSTDYIEVLNPNTNEWEQWERSGVVFEGTNVIVSTKNLNGNTVTLTVGGQTYSGTFVGGACTFTVYATGTATVSCAGYSASVTVKENETSYVEVSRPPATLTLTTDNLNGTVVYVKIAGVTYQGTFTNGKAVFTIYEVGTATITSSTLTKTQTIASGGSYTVDMTRPFAVIDFTTSDLNGKTVVVNVGGATYTGVFSSNKCRVTVYTFGTATITCDYASTTLTVESGESYTATLNRPYSTLNLTTETLEGEAVTVVVGGTTYKGTFSGGKCTIKVYDKFGSATITSTNASKTFTVESGKTHTVTLNRPKAIIHLTTDNLQNQTITFSVDGGTSNQVAFGSDGTLDLTVYVFGTYTFTCSETTVEQVVESGGEYTVDITEITRVYLVENGALVNGTEFVSTQCNGANGTGDGASFFVLSDKGGTHSNWSDLFKIPKNNKFGGKTLTIEMYYGSQQGGEDGYTAYHPPGFTYRTAFRYRYGLTSSNYYIDSDVTEEVIDGRIYCTIELPEDIFSVGYNENHYINLKTLPTYVQSYMNIRIENIYVE